jgi:hypothetical protein
MMDRAFGPAIPYIMNEKPELVEKFDGFTYYPNTISYGGHTNFASPALFGGYEYTPERMNQRDTELLVDKHNEALKVMPVLFGENGYEVTIFDPSYAGYTWNPDLSIYDDHPEFNCYNTNGYFDFFEGQEDAGTLLDRVDEVRNRNFFFYSLTKISPVLLQRTIYDEGAYNEERFSGKGEVANVTVQKVDGISKSAGYDPDFLNAYSVLTHMKDMTNITEGSQNTFFVMSNDTVHSECLLQEPDYTPELVVDNTAYDVDMVSRYTVNGRTMDMSEVKQVRNYQVNMAALLKLADWFDYLREAGVYDNTRIILVSDHGFDVNCFDIMCGEEDLEAFMPLLMVKDFNAKGFTVADDFMTNADTPVLATNGLIPDPKNPFTGNPIDSHLKEGPQLVFSSEKWTTYVNNGTRFIPGKWYSFEGDPSNPEDWEYVGEH